MKHLTNILKLLDTLKRSPLFHSFVIQSKPGWAKTTTIQEALNKLKIEYTSLGSYSTPLHFYNKLAENPESFLIVDDCAGLFSDTTSMAILKSATWSNSGHEGLRKVSWGSTSEKVQIPEFIFSGKIVILTNALPFGLETESFLSRCLSYRIQFSKEERKDLLFQGARSKKHFSDTLLAVRVAKFLINLLENQEALYAPLSLRTLAMGYELARTQPSEWESLLQILLQQKARVQPEEIVPTLAGSYLPIKPHRYHRQLPLFSSNCR